MEYFRKYFKEIVTIVVLLMGVYFLVLLTMVQSKFEYYNSKSFAGAGHYEYLGAGGSSGSAHHTVLNKRTGNLEVRKALRLDLDKNRYLKND